jgi:hypothetical protein
VTPNSTKGPLATEPPLPGDGRTVGAQCRTLHAVDRDVSSSHAGYFADVASVRGDHGMVPADRPLDNRDVNDVVVTSPSRQCPDRPGLGLGEVPQCRTLSTSATGSPVARRANPQRAHPRALSGGALAGEQPGEATT